jgi:hypothetical protein
MGQVEALKAMKFKGPVRFYNMGNGGARQDYEAVDEPRLGYSWEKARRKEGGAERKFFTVDGRAVADLDEAVKLLALPEPYDSPNQLRRKGLAEHFAEPQLTRHLRAGNDAECNWRAGPFAMMRAFIDRAGTAWHGGINKYADDERKAEREWPHWLYTVKDAGFEASRLMLLFQQDRDADVDLRCALGKRCRDCPILQAIETSMVASRAAPFSRGVEDWDIDAAKTWTCIGHILHEKVEPFDGGFLSTARDREHSW